MLENLRYTISYNVCSLLFLLVIAGHFYFRNRLHSKQNTLFGWLIAVSIGDIVLDCVTAVTVGMTDRIPMWLNQTLNCLFYAMQATLPMMMLLYILSMAGMLDKKHRGAVLAALIPYAFSIITVALNPLTGMYFTFENGVYTHSALFFLLLVIAGLYIFVSAAVLLCCRRRISKVKLNTVLIFVLFTAAAVVLQNVFFPEYLLTGMAIALSVAMMYLTFQNPEELRDEATNYFNRGSFSEFCAEGSVNLPDFSGAVFCVDNYAAIGEHFGSVFARAAIAAFAEGMRKAVPRARGFRIAENRIMLLCKSPDACRVAIALITDRAALPYHVKGAEIKLEVSTCCFFGVDLTQAGDPLAMVDTAVDELTRRGQKSFVADGDFTEKLRRERNIAQVLEKQLAEEDGLQVYFQPIYSLAQGTLGAAEVLVRMKHPEYGIVPPAELIPIAELNGHIVRQGELMFRKTCSFIRVHGLDKRADIEHIEINISPLELLSDGFTAYVLDTLGEYEIRPDFLILCLTSAAVSVSQQDVLRRLSELCGKGVRFGFNSNGLGYASLNNLLGMPYSLVRLDRSVVPEFSGGRDSTVFGHTVQLLSELGFETAVPGVENDFQLELMRRLGVNYVQGYYYAKPMTADEYIRFLENGETASSSGV